MRDGGRRYLLVPTGGRGEGTGHLVRCVRLARDLGRGCGFHPGWLDAAARARLEQMLDAIRASARPVIIEAGAPATPWGLVLVDKRRTSIAELAALSRYGTVACLDEGGAARAAAPYLVDALPRLPRGPGANTASLSYLGMRPARGSGSHRRPAKRPTRVLVSFGGEDAADLSGAFLRAALDEGLFAPENVTLVEGPLFGAREWPAGIRVVRGVRDLKRLFPRHDLLATHFGMSALEALAAGLPVVQVNPTRYHRDLSRAVGIPEVGIRRVSGRRLRALLEDPRGLRDAVRSFQRRLSDEDRGTLARHLGSLSPGTPECPNCGAVGRVVGRFPLRTYRHCPACGIEYLQSFAGPGRSYGKGYFFEEYRAQYGRTYLEDFDAIEAVGRTRVALLERALGSRARAADRGTIVDVGCAYGPFLEALRKAGWPCFGIDVAGDAVAHVRNVLGLPAERLPLERLERHRVPGARVDGVTLWYVIEHLDDLAAALRRIHGLLAPGGVLAFSTPNGSGISARRSRHVFLGASPPDHRTVLSPGGLRGLLRARGFRLVRVRVTGHHPERFPGLAGRWGAGRGAGRTLVLAASRALRLGDTFEAYAVRDR